MVVVMPRGSVTLIYPRLLDRFENAFIAGMPLFFRKIRQGQHERIQRRKTDNGGIDVVVRSSECFRNLLYVEPVHRASLST